MKNKTVLLAVAGLIIGVVASYVTGGEGNTLVSYAASGGIVGFLAGWVWQAQSGGSE